MAANEGTFRIAKVDSSAASNAYEFHATTAAADPHIWPRTDDQIKQYTESNSLFGVWDEDTGEIVGIAYAVFDEQWEIGGLSVAQTAQGNGLGTALVRFALAHTMVFEQPWANSPKKEIVAHVHRENDAPRGLLEKVGFAHSKEVSIPGDIAPMSMRRDASGNVPGDELKFTAEGLVRLSKWFNDEFEGDPSGRIVFDLGPFALDDLRNALRQMEGQTPG